MGRLEAETMLDAARRNALILSCCQGLYLSCSSVGIALSALVGATLAPTAALTTLPYSLIVLTTACTTVPISFFMAKVGRRAGFIGGAMLGGLGGAISAAGISLESFATFCIGNALMGCFQASAQYYRFAAADGVDQAFKARAVSWVMTGGVIAAVLGPTIASYSKNIFPSVLYAGSFLAIAVLALIAIVLLAQLRLPSTETNSKSGGGRPLTEIARQPAFTAAVTNSVLGYAAMSFIMTATPLAVVACGNSSDDAINVIRVHLIGMFLPSFFTGRLITRYGVGTILVVGAGLSLCCALVAILGTTLVHFWIALIALGVGWNFMYIGGTTLLTSTYRPEERAKVQATNEFLTFGTVALASLAAGGVFGRFGWSAVNFSIIPLLLFAALTVGWCITSRPGFSKASTT
jgi:MFS family permease